MRTARSLRGAVLMLMILGLSGGCYTPANRKFLMTPIPESRPAEKPVVNLVQTGFLASLVACRRGVDSSDRFEVSDEPAAIRIEIESIQRSEVSVFAALPLLTFTLIPGKMGTDWRGARGSIHIEGIGGPDPSVRVAESSSWAGLFLIPFAHAYGWSYAGEREAAETASKACLLVPHDLAQKYVDYHPVAWSRASDRDNLIGYRAFVAAYPTSENAPAAQERIVKLSAP